MQTEAFTALPAVDYMLDDSEIVDYVAAHAPDVDPQEVVNSVEFHSLPAEGTTVGEWLDRLIAERR